MPHRYNPTPPPLASLRQQPSWTNRAGRIDRSACLDVPARELAFTTPFTTTPAARQRQNPNRPPRPPNLKTPIAKATVTVTAQTLHDLQYRQLPYTLAGDQRTPRANAMKPHTPYEPRFPPNPNKGAARTKILGLPTDPSPHPKGWQQQLTLLRFRTAPGFYRHTLLCPHCQRRVYKLFLPLCTEREYFDAQFAHAWLVLKQARNPNAPGTQQEATIIQRYATILPPRTLLCRHCLNLSYAEPPLRARQSQQHNKPIKTTPPKTRA